VTRWPVVLLAVIGPSSIAVLRFVLPYSTTADSEAAAAAVVQDPQGQNAVLWLGLVAGLTLVPGLVALWGRMPGGRLRETGFVLTMLGYLCVPAILVTDMLLWLGATQDLPAQTTARLLDGVHPSLDVQIALFVPTHILGVVLIGVLALRARLVPVAVAWALTVSQPLHLLSVVLGLPELDLVAWGMTALGCGWLAATLSPARPGRGVVPADPAPVTA
jgi:hypothetical protein